MDENTDASDKFTNKPYHKQTDGLYNHSKCIYALDRLHQLKNRASLIRSFDQVFTANFKQLQQANRINLANIFAKNQHT